MNALKPKRLAILCGIANYGKPFGNIPAVASDLHQLSVTLRTGLHEDFRYDEVRVYTDEQVTLTLLDSILEELKHNSPIDELLFYLAGHGCLRGKHHYFVTYGAELVRPGIRLDELAEALQEVHPPKTIAVFDFCHAGAIPESLSPIDDVPIDGTERLAILAAARAKELAIAGGGVKKSFTQHFIHALTGATPDDAGIIRWGNVGMHVCSVMERNLNQRPVDRGQYIRTHPVNKVWRQTPVSKTAGTEKCVVQKMGVVRTEHRQGTVCILKIANYATLSQRLDVEDLDEVLHRYYQSCEEVINEFEGSIVNQHSEKLLTYFGYPKSHEDDAFRAVRCGLKILDDIVRLNNELQQKIKIIAEEPVSLKISIHSGSVMLTSNSVNYTPIGKALTLVDQLNALAKTNLLVISADTHRQIKGGFTCSSLGYVNFEGISAPQEIYQVINENSHHSRFDFRRSSGLTPLVGRKSEIGWLLECWSRIKEGQGEVMQISGIPGIGKSRLIHDFKLLIQQDSYTLLECQCWEHKETTPFGPLIELLERLLDFSQADPVEQKLSKLEAVLSKYGFALTEIMPLFVMLLSFPVTRAYPSIKQKTANQRRRTIDSILSLLFKIAEEKPLLVIVEDLHWADPSTLELLGLFVRQAPTYHVFFLFTFRPEFIPPWYNQPSYITQMNLRTLMPEHARSIVTNTAGGKKLPSEITEQLLTSTEGVPLFIEEWTKAILESGILERRETSYEFSDASLGLDIPTTLHELLLVRLDRLGSAKEVAQLGAVIGRQFSYELIRLISPLKEKALQKELDRLVAAELLFTRGIPPKSSYLFKHSLIQDTAYNALPKARKIQLHKSIAQALIDKFPEVVSTQPELLAHHYTAADLREQAVDYWHRAGNKALDRFALSESIGHFNKALEMLQMLTESAGRDRQELEIRLSLGTALSSKCYASPEVEKCYAKAFELSRQLSDFSQLFPVLRGLWCCYIGQAKFQLAKETCEQLLTLASEEGDLVHLIEANRTMGVILLWTGKLDLARDYLEQGSALYAQQQVRSNSLVYGIDPGAICLIYTAWVLLFMGYPERASRIRDEALTLSGEIGHPFTQAFTYTFAAWFNQFSRDCSGAYKMAIQAVARSSEFGFNQWLSWGRILLGWALAGQGDEEGLEQVKLGLTEARADSLDHGLSAFLALQSDIHSKLDQFSQSLVILNEAIDFANASGERFYEAELYRNKGELLLAHTSFGEAEAETLFRRAFDVAHCQGAKLFELRAVSSLARLLHRQGRAQEALKLMESSYAWFTEGFETPDLKDAQELIQILSGKDDKELR